MRMDVPKFPAPPTPLGPAFPSHRDVPDVAVAIRHHVTTGGGGKRASEMAGQPWKRRGHRLARLDNVIHPRVITRKLLKSCRVTELKLRMTEHPDEDDADVVCATGTPSTLHNISLDLDPHEQFTTPTPGYEHTVADGISVDLKGESAIAMPRSCSTAVQTRRCDGPYMLKVLPTLKDIVDNDTSRGMSKVWRHLRFLGRLSLCQFGLAWLLVFWTIAGASAFYSTEGPRERQQVYELKNMQRDLAVGLATELRQLRASEEEMEPLWSNKVKQYVAKHEALLLAAVNSGYGEGGDTAGGQLWNFPGCMLFAISLITTLGFGAPVPRTTAGRIVAVVFAAIGIPAHFLLVFNVGLLLAVHLQKFAIARRYGVASCDREASENLTVPKWVKVVPFVCIASYYVLGILGFGAGRQRPFAASLLFPLDFTAAGGLATTSGVVRIVYGLYLEGAVTIAAVAVAVLRVSASQSLTNIGLKYGLLTEV